MANQAPFNESTILITVHVFNSTTTLRYACYDADQHRWSPPSTTRASRLAWSYLTQTLPLAGGIPTGAAYRIVVCDRRTEVL